MNDAKHPGIEQYEYKAEMRQLLHLIIHSLYTHPEIFLRELISNASDALNKVRFMQLTGATVADPDAKLGITIDVNEERRTISIEDTGVGMTREDLVDRIGTIASSGTLEFLKKMKEQNAAVDGNLIGQFGVGFYSVFMVTDEVTIETRHADPDAKGLRWKSGGEGTYTIEEIDRKARGTRIFFTLKEEAKEFAQQYRISGIIRKYSNFVDFPITLGLEQVNKVSALWHRSKDDITPEELTEFYKFVSNDWQDPLGHLQLSIEGRVNFKALLFVPKTAPVRFVDLRDEKNLHLYSNKVFIQDDCKELLPDYLRFLRGVVDTEDLPLNVSREVTQSSPVLAKIRDVITGRILTMLEEWLRNEPAKYDEFFQKFGMLFKTGVNEDFSHRDRIIDLLRIETTKTEKGAFTSLREYVQRMQADQKEIYYLSGDTREAVERNPKLEYFQKKGLEVILLTDPVDVFVVPSVNEYDQRKLVSVEKADLNIGKDDEPADALSKKEAKSLLEVFRQTLGDAVEDVTESKRLVDSAATLVTGKDGMDAQMERMMKMMDTNYTGSKKILEINLAHPLIRNLATLHAADGESAFVRDCIRQIHAGALLIEDTLDTPADFVRRMTEIMERATRA
jgi:molecular chaperone HtpG